MQRPPDMQRMMREMEGMMGGLPRRPLISRLLDTERLSEAERNSLRGDAERRVRAGRARLEEGTRDLAAARGRGDEPALDRALRTIAEGVTLWETGRAVEDALSSPGTNPKDSALSWFKAQMNLGAPPPRPTALPWGLSWFHAAVMVTLAIFAVGGVAAYLYKVRRAISLLGQVTRRSGER